MKDVMSVEETPSKASAKASKHVIARAALQRSVRAAIRLRHSLAADAEVAERLPEILAAFDAAVLAGEAYEFDIGSLLDEPAPKPKAARRTTRRSR